MTEQSIKRIIWLTYLEGLREAAECMDHHDLETLSRRIGHVEADLGHPTRSASRAPLKELGRPHSSTPTAKEVNK